MIMRFVFFLLYLPLCGIYSQPPAVMEPLPDTLFFNPVNSVFRKKFSVPQENMLTSFTQPEGFLFTMKKETGLFAGLTRPGGTLVIELPSPVNRFLQAGYGRFLTFLGPLFLVRYRYVHPTDTACISEITAYLKPAFDSVLILETTTQCNVSGKGYYPGYGTVSYDTLDESPIPDDIVEHLYPSTDTYTRKISADFKEDRLLLTRELLLSHSSGEETETISRVVACYLYDRGLFIRQAKICE